MLKKTDLTYRCPAAHTGLHLKTDLKPGDLQHDTSKTSDTPQVKTPVAPTSASCPSFPSSPLSAIAGKDTHAGNTTNGSEPKTAAIKRAPTLSAKEG